MSFEIHSDTIDDPLMKDEIQLLTETFGEITPDIEKRYIDLTIKHDWKPIVQAFEILKQQDNRTMDKLEEILRVLI